MVNRQSKIETEIFKKICKAYDTLLFKDTYLLDVNANERSITHKLAEYLQIEFPDWNVDCEYNRNGIDVKKLDTFVRNVNSNDTDAVSVYPDIIVHHRGTDDNLVVIEAKKNNSHSEDLDQQKLNAYKNDLGYKFAYKIIFPTEKESLNNFDISDYIQEIV